MFPSLFANSPLQGLEKSVEFADRRHAILASNIANMDTPGYKTRDLSVENFQDSLKQLTATRKQQAEMSPGLRWSILEPSQDGAPLPLTNEEAVENVHDMMRQVVYHDGSDDNLEIQVLEMAKNQTMHQTAIALMRSQFQTLKMAITESVNV